MQLAGSQTLMTCKDIDSFKSTNSSPRGCNYDRGDGIENFNNFESHKWADPRSRVFRELTVSRQFVRFGLHFNEKFT